MSVFDKIGGAAVPRSVFDLSHIVSLTCDMGQLIPFLTRELYPSDVVQLGANLKIRMQPLVSPVLHEINAFLHYFFVPNRLMVNEKTVTEYSDTGTWEDFISGGEDGTDATTLPVWDPGVGKTAIGTLWDYLGYPITTDPDGAYPLVFGQRGYALIYNHFYRAQEIVTEVGLDNEDLLYRAWERDYFTSSLPDLQKGTAPALPISGTLGLEWDAGISGSAGNLNLQVSSSASNVIYAQNAQGAANIEGALERGYVDLSGGTTFDISDLRLTTQIQIWLERNQRSGSRMTEFILSHFGIFNNDARLQRPEWIGGARIPLIISEVLQTESSDASTPQGTMAGHGITMDTRNIGKYRATEHGWLFGILSIMPRSAYSQGIERQWLRETKYDFYFPEFAGLSEQAVIRAEIYTNNTSADNLTLFGYQGRYNELRQVPNFIRGQLRTNTEGGNLYWWTCSREFTSAPTLNDTFITCDGHTGGAANPLKRIFAVPAEDGFIVQIGNLIRAVRPIPAMAVPGGMDHA